MTLSTSVVRQVKALEVNVSRKKRKSTSYRVEKGGNRRKSTRQSLSLLEYLNYLQEDQQALVFG